MKANHKIIIYQVLPRLFGNNKTHCRAGGSIEQNGCGKFSDFSTRALQEIRGLGVTHIWYTGIIEHATQTDYSTYGITPDHPAVVKGRAGSPYAIKDYYDVDPDLADHVEQRMTEFEQLVKRTHRQKLSVIIDFVPNHVARQYHSDNQPAGTMQLGEADRTDVAFDPQNNFYYIPDHALRGQFDMKADAPQPYVEMPAKATGNDRFDATPGMNDWYETVKLNYGVDYLHSGTTNFMPIPDTWIRMRDILLFWSAKGVDGFRCDMAEMVPVEFWAWCIPQIKQHYPQLIFIAEVYDPARYHDYIDKGQFDYLYDKVGLYDTLRHVTCGYTSATAISRSWQSLGGLEQKMLNFMENHDEQRLASDYVAADGFRAIPAVIVAACMNTNPMMIYFGQELGERGMEAEGYSGLDGRTTIFDYWSLNSIRRWRDEGHFSGRLLDTHEKKLQDIYRRILQICLHEACISQGAFFDLTYANVQGWKFNEHQQYAILRKHEAEVLLIIVNFDSMDVHVAVNLPSHAFDCLQIPPIEVVEAVDLLTDIPEQISVLPYKATETHLPARGGKILKFCI